jgi:hypothetical protein
MEANGVGQSEALREARLQAWEKRRTTTNEESATTAQLKFIGDLGGTVASGATKDEAAELIGRLLAEGDAPRSSPSILPRSPKKSDDAKLHEAVAGHQIKSG